MAENKDRTLTRLMRHHQRWPLIDTEEHRCVGVVDMPGAFMQADDNNGMIMCIEGKMAEWLTEIKDIESR